MFGMMTKPKTTNIIPFPVKKPQWGVSQISMPEYQQAQQKLTDFWDRLLEQSDELIKPGAKLAAQCRQTQQIQKKHMDIYKDD